VDWLLTASQRELVERAGKLADVFASRAAVHDSENTFPFRNFDDLRDAGFLRLSVPTELGGLGAGLADILPVLERLAMGDGATALAVTMHISPLGQWSSIWRRTRNPRLEELLRMAAQGSLVWASLTSEKGLRNDMTDARTVAVKVPRGYRVTGRKIFATNNAVATHCSVTARDDHADGGPRLLLCQIAFDQPGISVQNTWNAMGMRATQSGDVILDQVFVPDEHVVHSLAINHIDARILETVWAWAMPAFSAVYTGIAAGAIEWTTKEMLRRGTSIDTAVQDVIGECVILSETSRALMFRHADEVSSRRLFEMSVQACLARCVLVKYVATNNAIRIVQQLVDVVGGAAYTRALPFERMWRDVQAGALMPMGNLATRRLVGANALSIRNSPVTEFDRTEHGFSEADPMLSSDV
jgi:alkylation response protein AidB-like acyl-CoA dehydrogenase